jgi:hypothetical protein
MMRIAHLLIGLSVALVPNARAGDFLLRDAIYLYGQPIDAAGNTWLGGYNCDVFELVLDVTSGATDLAMLQGDDNAELGASTQIYPDRIHASAQMFAYALYKDKDYKYFQFGDSTASASTARIGTATIFGYCFSSRPGAYAYLTDMAACTVRYSDGSIEPLPFCSANLANRE